MSKSAKDRNRGLGLLATTIEKIWGGRCTLPEPSCPTCHAWQVFDHLAALTDCSYLDDFDGPVAPEPWE